MRVRAGASRRPTRAAVARRRARRPRRLPAQSARRPSAPPRPRRRWKRWALALLALLALVWWLWPAPEPPPPPPPPVAAKPAPRPPPKPPVVPKKPAPAPAAWSPPKALLRAAILERASDLAQCALPPGSPARLVTNLRIAKNGAVRTAAFANAEPIPPALAQCARERMLAWSFAEIPLQQDVDVLVTFRLGK